MEQQQAYALIEQHYRENYAKIVKRVLKNVKLIDRAEDVAQEAYTRALTYWKTIPPAEEFEPWFTTVLINCLKDKNKEEGTHGMADDIADMEIAIKGHAIPKVIYTDVVRHIEKQPKSDRVIIDLFLIQGYKVKDICRLVPEGPNAIRQLIYRFRKELREKFAWEY